MSRDTIRTRRVTMRKRTRRNRLSVGGPSCLLASFPAGPGKRGETPVGCEDSVRRFIRFVLPLWNECIECFCYRDDRSGTERQTRDRELAAGARIVGALSNSGLKALAQVLG